MHNKDYIFVTIDYKRFEVSKKRYIEAKTKSLIKFGYQDLTEKSVEKELDRILNGKGWTDVIGGFIEADKPSYSKEEPPQIKLEPKKSSNKNKTKKKI